MLGIFTVQWKYYNGCDENCWKKMELYKIDTFIGSVKKIYEKMSQKN